MRYKLTLLSLKCYLSDEDDGDEIFIKMDGEKIWPDPEKYMTIVDEDTPIDLEFIISKGDSFDLELWDYDLLSANDLLGKISIQATSHGHFLTDFHKTASDESKYALEWEVS